MNKTDTTAEVRATVAATLRDELKNIAANNGVSLCSFLRIHLRQISNSYPEELRKKTIRQS
jgi:hypothetical protein